jgi:hypothetical protein
MVHQERMVYGKELPQGETRMKHYKNLWKFAPGAMTVAHIFVTGTVVTAALSKRDPLAALAAFLATLMVAVALIPVCSLWDLSR